MSKKGRRPLFCILLALVMTIGAWAGADSWKAQVPLAQAQTTPPLPANFTPPNYDYSSPKSCGACHFLLGFDHTSRALGAMFNNATQSWQLTGDGWLSSWHSQSAHGSNENTFCGKCHAPLQASASASFDNGLFVNTDQVPQGKFAAVTCVTCHPPDNVATVLVAQNPDAVLGGALGIYLWKGYSNPASYQPIAPGQEDTLCLHCHEQRHNTDNPVFQKMYSNSVKCIDCHMAAYLIFTGTPDNPQPPLTERFHDWKVAGNLPYSCGVQGSLSGCHSGFTVTDAQNIIPFIKEQHSAWWSLPPFNGQLQVAVSAHSQMTVADYKLLWQEIAKIDAAS
jgi:hypothetical protein